jgi:uncharacterized protein
VSYYTAGLKFSNLIGSQQFRGNGSKEYWMKTILWENRESHSLEYFNLSARGDGFTLAGTVVLLLDKLPAQISYRVDCTRHWQTRRVTINQERDGDTKDLVLETSDRQTWHTADSDLSFASGIVDIDLEITPATNTLPLRRAVLGVGESMQVDALWVRFPALTLEILPQRYTRLASNLYRYESLSSGFNTELEVDELGLVVDYKGLWRSVRP